jgi:hypothetical protein
MFTQALPSIAQSCGLESAAEAVPKFGHATREESRVRLERVGHWTKYNGLRQMGKYID